MICWRENPDAAHLRAGNLDYDKDPTGMAQKPSDCWGLPLCRDHHDEQHRGNELAFWERYGIDPFATAVALFKVSGDVAAGLAIIRGARL